MLGPRLVITIVAAVAAVAGLTGCAGQSCDDLPGLQADRERQRAAYLTLLTDPNRTTAQTGAADDALHAFERRVLDLETACARR